MLVANNPHLLDPRRALPAVQELASGRAPILSLACVSSSFRWMTASYRGTERLELVLSERRFRTCSTRRRIEA